MFAFGKELAKVLQNALDGFYVFGIAIDSQVLAARVNAHIQQRLEVFDVLVVNAEKRFQAPGWKFDLLQKRGRSPSAERNWFSLFSGV